MIDIKDKDILCECKKIDAPQDLVDELLELHKELQSDENLAELFMQTKDEFLNKKVGEKPENISETKWKQLNALIVLLSFPLMEQRYQDLGIDIEVSRATQKDLLLWLKAEKEQSGNWGLGVINWFRNHISGQLFQLGRLQFMPVLWYGPDAGEICHNDPVIDVHIPASGKLDLQECALSLKEASIFFRKYFPDFKFKALACDTWFLDPALKKILHEDSNIIGFQKMWELHPSPRDEQDANIRVFGQHPVDINKAPQKSSLQKKMLSCIQEGKPIRSGIGIIHA